MVVCGRDSVTHIPERDIAVLAERYLHIAAWGMPGYAAFEAGRRYIQV